jgi:hypothetical protein
MRLEATIPDSQGSAVEGLAEELGLSRSQIMDKALSLFVKVVPEVRRGRRLLTVDPDNQVACELVTPTLAAIEWALKPAKLELPEPAWAKTHELTTVSARPNTRLRAAVKRRRR